MNVCAEKNDIKREKKEGYGMKRNIYHVCVYIESQRKPFPEFASSSITDNNKTLNVTRYSSLVKTINIINSKN